MKSYITQNKETGAKCLTVFYDRKLDDFDQAIEKGLTDHGLKRGEGAVIALPSSCGNVTQKPFFTDTIQTHHG